MPDHWCFQMLSVILAVLSNMRESSWIICFSSICDSLWIPGITLSVFAQSYPTAQILEYTRWCIPYTVMICEPFGIGYHYIYSNILDSILQQQLIYHNIPWLLPLYICLHSCIDQDASPLATFVSAAESLAYLSCSIESLQHMQGALELVVSCKVALVHNQDLRNGNGMEWVSYGQIKSWCEIYPFRIPVIFSF